MRDATCYLVRLMEHRSSDGTVDKHWDMDTSRLLIAIRLHYADKDNVRQCGEMYSVLVTNGFLCTIQKQQRSPSAEACLLLFATVHRNLCYIEIYARFLCL